ncbi:MAG: hypothetical protein ACT4PI_15875 [Actinomycetota bacterium]
MLLWYAGLSILLVHYVFRSSGVDYRLIAAGALLPLAIDLPLRRLAYGHTLAAGILLMVLVMVGTIGRSRLLRRRLLCLPIGFLCGLVLSGAWTEADVFWWPVTGALPHEPLLPPLAIVALEELVGLVACGWVVIEFGLTEPLQRLAFLRSGRLHVK